MQDLDHRVKTAFDAIRADEDLKASAIACIRKKTVKPSRSFRPAAALVCMLLVFFSGYFCRMILEPVSVISIDINPSIELGINTFDRVVSVEAFNKDGREVLEQIELRFLNYEEAVERIVGSETVTGLLEQEEELVITVVGEDEVRSGKLCSTLKTCTPSGSHCYSVLPQEVASAHGCGMSYGKYRAYQQALQQNAELTVEQTQDMTIKEIGETVSETIPEATRPQQHEPKQHNHSYKHQNGHH